MDPLFNGRIQLRAVFPNQRGKNYPEASRRKKIEKPYVGLEKQLRQFENDFWRMGFAFKPDFRAKFAHH